MENCICKMCQDNHKPLNFSCKHSFCNHFLHRIILFNEDKVIEELNLTTPMILFCPQCNKGSLKIKKEEILKLTNDLLTQSNSICKQHSSVNLFLCLSCNNTMCHLCLPEHITTFKDHIFSHISQQKDNLCPKHLKDNEMYKFKCITCSYTNVCQMCIQESHKNHSLISINVYCDEIVQKMKTEYLWLNDEVVEKYFENEFVKLKNKIQVEKLLLNQVCNDLIKLINEIKNIANEGYDKVDAQLQQNKEIIVKSYLRYNKEVKDTAFRNYLKLKVRKQDYYLNKYNFNKVLFNKISDLYDNLKREKIELNSNKLIRAINFSNHALYKVLKTDTPVNQIVQLYEDILITCSDSSEIKIWDLNYSNLPVKILSEHSASVKCLLNLKNNLLISGSKDHTIRVWDLGGEMKCIKVLSGHSSSITKLLETKDGSLISCGGKDKTMRVWNMIDYTCMYELKSHTGNIIDILLIDNCNILSASDDRTIRLWDSKNEYKCIRIYEDCKATISCFISIQSNLIVSGSDDKLIRVWDINAKLLSYLQGHTGKITCIVGLDDKLLASAAKEYKIRVWELNTYSCLRILDGHSDTINVLLYEYGKIISASTDYTVRVYDSNDDFKCINVLKGIQELMKQIILLKDGKIVAGETSLYIWG
jgi:WD40 repeat protein